MTGITGTYYPNHALAFNDLAIFASAFYGCSYFHTCILPDFQYYNLYIKKEHSVQAAKKPPDSKFDYTRGGNGA
jgi:hypothetical protein